MCNNIRHDLTILSYLVWAVSRFSSAQVRTLTEFTTSMSRIKLFCLCFCLSGFVYADQVVKAYVSIPPQKYFVEKIGGQYVEARVMIEPGQTPETFSPTPKKLTTLAQSDIYFRMNVPLENIWMDSIRDINENLKVVDCCSLPGEATYLDDELDSDIHVWTNPKNVIPMAKLIKRELIDIAPAHEQAYEANFRELKKKLEELDGFIEDKLAHRRTSYFLVAHAAWGHYAAAYGLKQLAVERSNGYVGPSALSEIINIAKREKIKTVFIQTQINPAVSQGLADEIGADLINLDPLAEDYVNNLRDVTLKISRAIQ